MKRTNWQNNQPILVQDLDWGFKSKEEAIKDRQLDISKFGIVENSQILNEDIPFKITINSGSIFSVGTGVAFDINGEKIEIKENSPYDYSNITMESPDGEGGYVITPQSSGNLNISIENIQPLADYYVWLNYLETVDTSEKRIKYQSNYIIYPKIDDGYYITVTGSNSPPSSNSIFVAKITADTVGNLSNISYAGRTYFGIKGENVRTILNQKEISFQEHVNSVGTGVISDKNPHGLSSDDLGIVDPGGKKHQSSAHTDGIYTDNVFSTNSALYAEIVYSTEIQNFILKIKKLKSNETIIHQGLLYDSSSIPTDYEFRFVDQFLLPLNEGYYVIYFDITDNQIKRYGPIYHTNLEYAKQLLGIYLNTITDHLLLYILYWGVIDNQGHYNFLEIQDKRKFGNLSAKNVAKDFLSGLLFGFNNQPTETFFYSGYFKSTITNKNKFAIFGTNLNLEINGNPYSINFPANLTGYSSLKYIAEYLDSKIPDAENFYVGITEENQLELAAPVSLKIIGGTSLVELGLDSYIGQSSSGDLKMIEIRDNLTKIYFNYDSNNNITESILIGNNKKYKQTYYYIDNNIVKIKEEEL